MPRVLVFDVNETLLDLAHLDRAFQEHFGDAAVRAAWFSLVLRTGMTETIIGQYHTFGEVGAAALAMLARAHGVTLSEAGRDRILTGMKHLPPQPDAPPALSRLKAAGFRLAALTNSTAEVARAQLTNAGLADHFEAILSVDAVKHLKPTAAVYRRAAADLGVDVADMWLVAAHDWDVAGAMAAGGHGVLIDREGTGPNPLYPAPDIVAKTLEDAAEVLTQNPD